jgi:hypothetical protein
MQNIKAYSARTLFWCHNSIKVTYFKSTMFFTATSITNYITVVYTGDDKTTNKW